jgi:hypothetical protein
MVRYLSVLGAALALSTVSATSHAYTLHRARHHNGLHGYSRSGPPHGLHFGFATAGDPFYDDDYYDGRGCYYLYHRDFCRGRKSLDWLLWRR